VAGFVIVVAPAGLGVREFLLTLLLAPELGQAAALEPDAARSAAILAVLVLRLVWTAGEAIVAAVLYPAMVVEARRRARPSDALGEPAGGEP
jgi:uncharacterized membrane protein YbhN (UPF0104 family)